MVAVRSRAGIRRWTARPTFQTPVVDADHVLGPLASREAVPLLEAGEPVVGSFGPHDEKRCIFFSNDEPSVRLVALLLHEITA